MAGVTYEIGGKHHNLTAAVVSREEKDITKLSPTQLEASPIPSVRMALTCLTW